MKGVGANIKEEIEEMLKNKLYIEIKLKAAWKSGQVIVGKCKHAKGIFVPVQCATFIYETSIPSCRAYHGLFSTASSIKTPINALWKVSFFDTYTSNTMDATYARETRRQYLFSLHRSIRLIARDTCQHLYTILRPRRSSSSNKYTHTRLYTFSMCLVPQRKKTITSQATEENEIRTTDDEIVLPEVTDQKLRTRQQLKNKAASKKQNK
uniref:Uncharacterized protein n=1 Tax=Trichogramma kaykai TaxID=54128 RepID=A0ABD2W7C2_9HYME